LAERELMVPTQYKKPKLEDILLKAVLLHMVTKA